MTITYKIKELPISERPRERLITHGASALSTMELLAVLLGSGTQGKSVLSLAQEILAHCGSLTKIQDASIADLCKVKGMGTAKAIQLKAALSLATRLYREKIPFTETLDSPVKAYLWVRDFIVHEKKETFGVILLDAKGAAMRWEMISVGTLTQTIVHPREVFYPAIRYLAASLILVHNHPSGDPNPSSQDRKLTQSLVTASTSLGIPIVDHLIICKDKFISFKEEDLF